MASHTLAEGTRAFTAKDSSDNDVSGQNVCAGEEITFEVKVKEGTPSLAAGDSLDLTCRWLDGTTELSEQNDTLNSGGTVTFQLKKSDFAPGDHTVKPEITGTPWPNELCELKPAGITFTILSVELKDGDTVIDENQYAYIDGDPEMPQLTARLKPDGLSGNAKWQLFIEYKREDRDDEEYYPGPNADSWKTVAASEAWNIADDFGENFRGGKCSLKFEYEETECQFIFHIRGYNPTEAAAKNYLNANGPWYAYCIAKHESGTQNNRTYLQFNELGTLGPNWNDYQYCPNRGPSSPRDWGMMQLTQFATEYGGEERQPYEQELWNWKENVDTAIDVMDVKKQEVQQHLKNMAPDGAGGYIMPPDTTVSGVEFKSGTAKTSDQLGFIKRYNAGWFWTAYDEETEEWTHVTLDGNDYTEKVLNEYEE